MSITLHLLFSLLKIFTSVIHFSYPCVTVPRDNFSRDTTRSSKCGLTRLGSDYMSYNSSGYSHLMFGLCRILPSPPHLYLSLVSLEAAAVRFCLDGTSGGGGKRKIRLIESNAKCRYLKKVDL